MMVTAVSYSRPQSVIHGVLLIVMGTFFISAQDAVIKIFSDNITLGQLFTVRGIIAIPLFLILAWGFNSQKGLLRQSIQPWVMLRSLGISLTLLLFYMALPFSQISTLGAVVYLAPILITVLSSFLINEPIKWTGWFGVFLGFCGVLVLLQPGTDAFSPWTLLPLAGACFYASAHVITRVHCRDVPTSAMALSLNCTMLLLGLLISIAVYLLPIDEALTTSHPYIFGQWKELGLPSWLVLIHLAAVSVLISFMVAGAYQSGPPSIVATFEYSFLIFAACWDVLFFETPLTLATIIGIIMIVLAGFCVLRR